MCAFGVEKASCFFWGVLFEGRVTWLKWSVVGIAGNGGGSFFVWFLHVMCWGV